LEIKNKGENWHLQKNLGEIGNEIHMVVVETAAQSKKINFN
jgi:hypothetical protein